MICNRKNCTNSIGENASKYCSTFCYHADREYDYKLNEISKLGDYMIVHLSGGYECLISKEDYGLVSKRLWHYAPRNGATSNLRKHERKYNQNGHIKMHRLIMDAPAGMVVDHINGNKIDNRRDNLRIATHSQNSINTPSRDMRNIEYRNGSYCVRMRVNNERIYIGNYKYLGDAKIARDDASKKYHGQYRSR